jgi:uncharacterized protein (DUF433 family)
MTATSPPTDIGKLITSTPGVYGGRPCLAGTRYPVVEIAVHYNAGTTPEQLAEDYSLPLEKVYAGYACYLANKKAFDREIEAEREEYESAKAAADPADRLNP